ncbi:piggyBac transposable element-derived protein 4-like isoform X2 [Acipenser ruthenus]|uniref:piggyBac transposable element-derived protein 4-like isoform X2 n=1 Tax=Acipenser ruthenus TaxID=7906 RepID=UPI0027424FFD|nr:piggyBac transposable element-derived protein 4-like isoform X2 [Acipenser ruthenus]
MEAAHISPELPIRWVVSADRTVEIKEEVTELGCDQANERILQEETPPSSITERGTGMTLVRLGRREESEMASSHIKEETPELEPVLAKEEVTVLGPVHLEEKSPVFDLLRSCFGSGPTSQKSLSSPLSDPVRHCRKRQKKTKTTNSLIVSDQREGGNNQIDHLQTEESRIEQTETETHREKLAQSRQRESLQPEELAQMMDEAESPDESGLDDDFDQSSDEEAVNFLLNEDSEESEKCDHEPDTQPEEGWKQAPVSADAFTKLPFTVRNKGFQGSTTLRTELEFFQLFFTDALCTEIVNETNRHASVKLTGPRCHNSIWNSWKPVTLPEMKAFFGVVLNMGLNVKTDIKEYFSGEWPDRMPFFKDVFKRSRFLQIFWMLHLCPPPTQVPQTAFVSRGQKVRNVVSYIDSKCRELFIPGRDICIDESTVGFKGRIIFKCYNPQKPTKWGMRVFVLADCETGYVSAIVPYFGSPTTDSLPRPDMQFSSRIVLHLCKTLLRTTNGHGFHLFTDRFYTGYDLAMELLKIKIHLTGTIMANRRGLPAPVKQGLKLKTNEPVSFSKDNKVMVLGWKDKRLVLMLSTFHGSDCEKVQRTIKRGAIEELEKPSVICDYTSKMGAVDRADHYCASYAFSRKSVKWWRKMFFWLLEVAIVNSAILFNLMKVESGQLPVRHKTFRKALLVQLVGNVRNTGSRKRGRPSSVDREDRLNGKTHFLAKKESKSTKDCTVCSDRKKKGGRRETVWFCKTCSRKPGLHPGDCFERFHTMDKYR